MESAPKVTAKIEFWWIPGRKKWQVTMMANNVRAWREFPEDVVVDLDIVDLEHFVDLIRRDMEAMLPF